MLSIHAGKQGGEIVLVLKQLLVNGLQVGYGAPSINGKWGEINFWYAIRLDLMRVSAFAKILCEVWWKSIHPFTNED